MPTRQPLQTNGPTRVVNGPGRLWAVLIAQWIHAVAAILTVQHKPCVLPPRLKPPAASSALWACLAGAGDGRWDHLQLAVYFGLASGGCSPALNPSAAAGSCGHQHPHKACASCKGVRTLEARTAMLPAEEPQSGRQRGPAKQSVPLGRHARLIGGQESLTIGCTPEGSCRDRQCVCRASSLAADQHQRARLPRPTCRNALLRSVYAREHRAEASISHLRLMRQ